MITRNNPAPTPASIPKLHEMEAISSCASFHGAVTAPFESTDTERIGDLVVRDSKSVCDEVRNGELSGMTA